MVRFTKLSSE
ncbi:hypothetical protein CGLO_07827 [Colletotrichum gloeosporioides Cg-14]|uniref:Uncharacterized protein n=1 Tax=Colletotrichum gloeosporioides (strain Cg-14) TaxID=1237896 RepID=T0KB20_COLGC|nr:hypothetical protein CGLO_07827 [Colletotrichum gloeosporioides Cg-14]